MSKGEVISEFYPDNRIHEAPPSEDRGDIRYVTPMGFARAVFEANRPNPTTEGR